MPVWLVLFSLAVTVPGVAQWLEPPPRVATSVGIFDVQSRDEIHRFSASEVRELVLMENRRPQNVRTVPHPVLVYCFEERTFRYTGGQFQDAEITYRLHTPKNIQFGRRYPLIVHLHGNGDDSLVHLHSILPMMIGPDRQDFFMLVTQAPRSGPGRGWQFRPTRDGSLDIVVAAMEHVIANNPIDRRRITATGISGGGWGVWELIQRYPDTFAGAVPTACSAPPPSPRLAALTRTPIWILNNREDRQVNTETIHAAMRVINGAGGSIALTEMDAPGHNALRYAIEKHDCFRWALAQRRGSWFSPPPGVTVHKPHSLLFVLFLFILPISIIVFFSWDTICEWASTVRQTAQEWISKT